MTYIGKLASQVAQAPLPLYKHFEPCKRLVALLLSYLRSLYDILQPWRRRGPRGQCPGLQGDTTYRFDSYREAHLC